MEAETATSNGILERVDDAKSPRRILVRSLLRSRNKLREKYRELRAECKRWRNQAAAVERSREGWRKRAVASEAAALERQEALQGLQSERDEFCRQLMQQEAELSELRGRLDAEDSAKKK
jgi:SMC interacting uncharacterized protein involved in chromosome segregation